MGFIQKQVRKERRKQHRRKVMYDKKYVKLLGRK